MRGIVKFDGGNDARRFNATDNEIHMLLRDAVGVATLPIAVSTRNNVGKTNLARNQIAISHDLREDTEKRGLVHGEQETSRPEDATL